MANLCQSVVTSLRDPLALVAVKTYKVVFRLLPKCLYSYRLCLIVANIT